MNRIYNRCDCVITMSRGEGWCMPLTEALLCEVPVIAPNSTAMAEYLDDSIAELVPTRELPVTHASGSFSENFRGGYGLPGITYYEPDIAAAGAAMRRVYEHRPKALAKARAGRERLLDTYTPAATAAGLEQALLRVLDG